MDEGDERDDRKDERRGSRRSRETGGGGQKESTTGSIDEIEAKEGRKEEGKREGGVFRAYMLSRLSTSEEYDGR